MKASERAKRLGCSSLDEVSKASNQSIQTLINWHNNPKKSKLFDVLCMGVVAKNGPTQLVGHVQRNEWSEIIRRNHTKILNSVIEKGGREALAKFLFSLDVNKDKDFDEFLSEFDARY